MNINILKKTLAVTLSCTIFCFSGFGLTDAKAISLKRGILSEQIDFRESVHIDHDKATEVGTKIIELITACIDANDTDSVLGNEKEIQDGGIFRYSTTPFTVISAYWHDNNYHDATAMIGYEVDRGEGAPGRWAAAGLTHWYPTRHKKAFYNLW